VIFNWVEVYPVKCLCCYLTGAYFIGTNLTNLIYPVEFRSADSPEVIFNWDAPNDLNEQNDPNELKEFSIQQSEFELLFQFFKGLPGSHRVIPGMRSK